MLALAVYVLGRVIERLLEAKWLKRQEYSQADRTGASGDRITLRDIREDLRSLRELESLSANKLAAMERDVEWIKLALRADGHGEA